MCPAQYSVNKLKTTRFNDLFPLAFVLLPAHETAPDHPRIRRVVHPLAARAELAPHERGGVANAIRIQLERAAQGLEPTQGAGKGAPQTLVQKTAPSSRTKEGLMTAEELEVKRARVEDHERIDALEKAVRRLEADAVKVDANMARLQHLW